MHCRLPTLTVYRDQDSGIRIALAVNRPGPLPTPVPWRRLGKATLDEAVSGALSAGQSRPAFALLLEEEGRAGPADATAALARCLARADLTGFTPGPELAA